MITFDEACVCLANLSPERAQRVMHLIEDLADLESRENAGDLAEARQALTESDFVSWEFLKADIENLHR